LAIPCKMYFCSKELFSLYPQEAKDDQWRRAMDYLKIVSELNYMTQIVIMLYEDPNKVRGRHMQYF